MSTEEGILDVPAALKPGKPSDEQQARSHVYRLLGALLAAPPDDQILTIAGNIEINAGASDDSLTNAWFKLKHAALHAQPESLKDEYFKLFIGLGKGEISPYASWYLTGFLMEKPLAELRTELIQLGFLRQSSISEPEDHAAALCEIMSVIIGESVLSFDREKEFFNKYIASWMGQFFIDLNDASSSVFYKPVAILGQRFLDIEQQYFLMPV